MYHLCCSNDHLSRCWPVAGAAVASAVAGLLMTVAAIEYWWAAAVVVDVMMMMMTTMMVKPAGEPYHNASGAENNARGTSS